MGFSKFYPMAFPRSYHNLTVLPDGTVLVTGGERTTDGDNVAQAVYEAEIWDPTSESWSTMAAMQMPRLYHSSAVLLPSGQVLVNGGELLSYIEENGEVFSPPYLFNGPRPTIAAAPQSISYGGAFSVDTPDALDVASVALLRPGTPTHGFNQNQRYVPLLFTPNANGVNVQSPANPNLAPPGDYMLFLLNTAGGPSVAEFVRLNLPTLRSLRFFGNGVNDIDRVKIPIDDPQNNDPGPPVDVGAEDFTIDFWMRAEAANNTAGPIDDGGDERWVTGNIIIDRDIWNGSEADWGISIAGGFDPCTRYQQFQYVRRYFTDPLETDFRYRYNLGTFAAEKRRQWRLS